MNTAKMIIKTFLRFPQKIIISLFFVVEIVLSKLTSLQFAFSNREYLFKRFDDEIRQVFHNNGKSKLEFMLHTPNCLCLFRQQSFSTKEPEMLEWIERFGGEGALYDIGANIGIYSIYYAKLKSGNVYSFERSSLPDSHQPAAARQPAESSHHRQNSMGNCDRTSDGELRREIR